MVIVTFAPKYLFRKSGPSTNFQVGFQFISTMILRALRYQGKQQGWRVPGLLVFSGTTTAAATGLYWSSSDEKLDQNKFLTVHSSRNRSNINSSNSNNNSTSENTWNMSYNHQTAMTFPSSFWSSSRTTACCEAASVPETTTTSADINDNDTEDMFMSEEEESFLNTLALYRRWLDGMRKQWAISSPASIGWPSYIPDRQDISSLETDLQNYVKGGQSQESRCQALEFRIASYYLFRESSVEQQRKGFHIVQKLAVDGHPDGLCLYGERIMSLSL